MCQDCPTARSRAQAAINELIADLIVLPLYILAVVFALVALSYLTA